MIIYNVTISIDPQVRDRWLKWMKEEHIPDVMDTGCFKDFRMCQVLSPEGAPPEQDQGGISYAIQYSCVDMATYRDYQERFAPALQSKTEEHFGGCYHAFRTLLEVLGPT